MDVGGGSASRLALDAAQDLRRSRPLYAAVLVKWPHLLQATARGAIGALLAIGRVDDVLVAGAASHDGGRSALVILRIAEAAVVGISFEIKAQRRRSSS